MVSLKAQATLFWIFIIATTIIFAGPILFSMAANMISVGGATYTESYINAKNTFILVCSPETGTTSKELKLTIPSKKALVFYTCPLLLEESSIQIANGEMIEGDNLNKLKSACNGDSHSVLFSRLTYGEAGLIFKRTELTANNEIFRCSAETEIEIAVGPGEYREIVFKDGQIVKIQNVVSVSGRVT